MKCLKCGRDPHAFDEDPWWRKDFCIACLKEIFPLALWDADAQAFRICDSCSNLLMTHWLLRQYVHQIG